MDTDVSVRPTTEHVLKEPSLYKAVLHNDDFTPMEFVKEILMQIFSKVPEEAEALVVKIHEEGSAIVGIYTREVGEMKIAQTIAAAEAHSFPLMATLEQA